MSLLIPCSATVAERRYDGGSTMPDYEIQEERERRDEIEELMREDAHVLRQTIGEDAFHDLWVGIHGALLAPAEPGRTWEQSQVTRAAQAALLLEQSVAEAVDIRMERENAARA